MTKYIYGNTRQKKRLKPTSLDDRKKDRSLLYLNDCTHLTITVN